MAHQDWSGAGLLLAWQGVSGWEVLLAERNEPPYLGYWSVPGGGSHFSDAAPFDTALRELGEELFQGIALQPLMRPFLGGDSANLTQLPQAGLGEPSCCPWQKKSRWKPWPSTLPKCAKPDGSLFPAYPDSFTRVCLSLLIISSCVRPLLPLWHQH